jgi:hypothetical protein
MQNNTNDKPKAGDAKRLILMRGLPSCGKSWTAKEIAAQTGGVVFEFDSYFEGAEGAEFHWSQRKLPQARALQYQKVSEAVDAGISPIIADDDHKPGATAKAISAYALSHGYKVEFAEPTSPWWKAIRLLLKDKERNGDALATWAQKLCRISANHHRVSLESFVSRMERWNEQMTLLDILAWGENLQANEDQETRTVA